MSERPPYEEQFDTTISRRARRERRRDASKKGGGGVLEFLIILVVSFVLVFGFVRPFVVEAFWIPSASMVPTLKYGDRVLVNKFIYRFTEPERGDIIVFKSVQGDDQDLIKRVVGVPGDEIKVRGGRLFVNGEPQREPYVNEKYPDRSFYAPTIVPKGHVFAMGDNRANSQDSRVFGPVPKENIEGEAFLRFWPPGRIGLLL
ncbi:MAG TPA: signal peptidase I [Rubrobacteraceae bacterium]|nr:signal peptidase I [Rubrobacteraceae bacterium]